MEEKEIWMRVGIVLKGSREVIEKVINGDEKALNALIDGGCYYFSGSAYLPLEAIEEYNDENDTDFVEVDRDFDL